MDKVYIIANWKLNPASADEAAWLLRAVGNESESLRGIGKALEVVLCPPFVYLPRLTIAKYKMRAGAQDCFWENRGAYTGEIAPSMLAELGCSYVILGHSERKNYLGETFEMVNRKIKAAIAAGIVPVVCIGEKKRGGGSKKQLEAQMGETLKDITPKQAAGLILVYEPEWAISSNKNAQAATPKDCEKAIGHMKTIAKNLLGERALPVLYGGSTTSENIQGFLGAGAAGALVGSSSLDAKEFIQIVKNAAA